MTTLAREFPTEASDIAGAEANAASAAACASIVAAFGLGQAVGVADGTLHPAGIACLALAIAAALAPVLLRPDRLTLYFGRVSFKTLIALCLAIQWAQLLAWGVREFDGHAVLVAAMVVAGGGAAMAFRRPRASLVILLLGHLIAGAIVIHSTPNVLSDARQVQQASAAALLRGENPYTVRYRNPYPPEANFYGPGVVVDGWLTYSYPYPPLTLLLAAPARAVGDVRWTHLIALELAGALIFLAGGRQVGAAAAAAMLLLTPRSLYVILAGWTEPMVALALAFLAFTAMRAPRWTWLSLGLLLAAKQYSVLLLPLAPLLLSQPWGWRDAVKLVARAMAVAATITIPFLLWDPPAFLRSVIAFQFVQPFRADALSFPAVIALLTGFQLSSAVAFVLSAGLLVVVWRRAERSPVGFMTAAALLLLVFFAFNKQAFCNYYFLVIAACCTAAGLRCSVDASACSPQAPGNGSGGTL